ncbi:MAG: CinA family protein [Chloroflexi bacterium]|nr:MAG: CinA family protein [Chloroflexota bacterium]
MRTLPSVFPAQSAMRKIITENDDGYNLAINSIEVNVTNPLETQVGRLLQERGLKLVLAESCTGGLLGSRITDVPGSSEYFLGSVVAYAYEAKATLLNVSWDTLNTKGAVSRETVLEMARGIRNVMKADIAISISGIAGPGGGTPEKPVGTTWIGFVVQGQERAEVFHFSGGREANKVFAVEAALQMLLDYLQHL